MKKYFLFSVLLLSFLKAAPSVTDRQFEIYTGMSYNLFTDSTLTRQFPTESITGYGFTMGIYLPLFYTLAISWDIGMEFQAGATSDVFSSPLEYRSIMQTFWLTTELDVHRLSAGLRYHMVSNIYYYDPNNLFFSGVDFKDNYGLAVSYEYNFKRDSALSVGLEYATTTFHDAQNNAYIDNNLKAFFKLKMVGMEGLYNAFTSPAGYYYY